MIWKAGSSIKVVERGYRFFVRDQRIVLTMRYFRATGGAVGNAAKRGPNTMSKQANSSSPKQFMAALNPIAPALEYLIDLSQRTILFWDVMRERGNRYREHEAKTVPHVLRYQVELIVDGRTLERPVNYALVRIVPPEGVTIDPKLRPFVIVDPRAGHGPGIGGFKADSEIGVALRAGHTCYFVGFMPNPMPGQTIEDIARAEAAFLEKVIALHPDADGKPCVVGNCQAGWAVMMLASVAPDLFGPIIIAGSPLSYWTGQRGLNPMRYTGGLLGGSWLAAFTSDIGHGIFDGAWLVQNFENLNPANTFWKKPYNLFSEVDTEAAHYLEFERWWGGHVNLTAAEMQFIVNELFVGNKLAAGEIKSSNGTAIDLRNIRSPIVVFCSKGDNITPPQQALGWILDLYDNVDEIRSYGQTIVYSVHESVGHLGIFVSGGVARKEHGEFASNIDLIDVLPPGLYEASVRSEVRRRDESRSRRRASGSCAAKQGTLDDIRALGGNDAADDRRFATVARMSEVNLALYRTFAQPFVRAMRDRADGGMDASPASDAAAIRVDVRRQSVRGDARAAGRLDARASQTGERRQSFLGSAGKSIAPDRIRARRLPRPPRRHVRSDVPSVLRIARGAGLVRDRSVLHRTVAESGKERAPQRVGAAADRRTEGADSRRWLARSGSPRADLCRDAARRCRRARL